MQCPVHGGSTSKAKAQEAVRTTELQARENLRKRIEREGPPELGSFVEQAERSLAMSIWWRDTVLRLLAEVDFEDWRYVHQHGEQTHALVTLFERAQAQTTKDIVSYGRLDIADRKLRIDEQQALMLFGVLQAVLNRLDLTQQQKALAAIAVPEELRRVGEVNDD